MAMHFYAENACHIWRNFCKVKEVNETEKIASNLQQNDN